MNRDWLGHALQMLGIFAVMGVPLLVWGISINTSVATIVTRNDRQDRDIADLIRVQTIINDHLNDQTKQLTRIDTQLEDILRGRKK